MYTQARNGKRDTPAAVLSTVRPSNHHHPSNQSCYHCCTFIQGFLAEGLQRTSAGLGSVIIDSQPLSVALLAALLFGEALSGLGVAGLFIGVAGLLLLEVPQDLLLQGLRSLGSPGAVDVQQGLAAVSSSSSGSWSLLDSGEFWMLLAAQSMAVGTVMVR